MTDKEIAEKASSFTLALAIERILSSGMRSFLTCLLLLVTVVSSSLVLVFFLVARFPELKNVLETNEQVWSSIIFLVVYSKELSLLAVFTFLIGLFFIAINAFSRFHYLRGVRRVFQEGDTDITYEVASIFSSPAPTLHDLFNEKESIFVINRLNLDKNYLSEQFGNLSLPSELSRALFEKHVTLGSLWRGVYEHHKELAEYMFSQSVKKKTLYGVTFWMDRILEDEKIKSAWWWRENLSKTRGFAKTLSYGLTAFIAKHSLEMVLDPKIRDIGDVILHQEESDKLEEILSKRNGSNAVIVGPLGSGRYTITLALTRAIKEGRVYAEIEHKRMFLLQASSFELIRLYLRIQSSHSLMKRLKHKILFW